MDQVYRIMEERGQLFLEQYINSLPPAQSKKYTSFSAGYFCADEYNANLCASLILRGEKRASCSMEYWYTHKDELIPQVGHLQVVTTWDGTPVCIIETTLVTRCQYNQVTEEFAALEGEGDGTLTWWKKAHQQFFSDECDQLGIEFKDDIFLVLEYFVLVYY